MDTLIIVLSLINGYYFAIKGIQEKESKEKIFYIIFLTIIFLLVMCILKMIGIGFLNMVVYFAFLFIVHSFYTNFELITKINEYFLKNSKQQEISLRLILLKLINKELILLKENMYSLFYSGKHVFDSLLLGIGCAFLTILLLHILKVIDIFVMIHNLW